MKDITTYINEVSRDLAKRAYDKASGAQKNRIKKLYKQIYGEDLEKSDISKIKFYLYHDAKNTDVFESGDLQDCFTYWPQYVIDKIKEISIDYWFDHGPNHGKQEGGFTIDIDGKEYSENVEYEGSDCNIVKSSLKYKHTESNIFEFIAYLYKEKYS